MSGKQRLSDNDDDIDHSDAVTSSSESSIDDQHVMRYRMLPIIAMWLNDAGIDCLLECLILWQIKFVVHYVYKVPSVLWRYWLGGRKGVRPVKKTEWWGAGMVICLERGADLHMAQLMPLLLTVSCCSKIQVGFTFLVPAYPGCPGKEAVKWL